MAMGLFNTLVTGALFGQQRHDIIHCTLITSLMSVHGARGRISPHTESEQHV
jgi:hypothetical protein